MQFAFGTTTRTANRLLFGIDLARSPEFTELSISYTGTTFGGASIIRYWPAPLRPVIMWWKSRIYQEQATARKLLVPILQQRIETEDRYSREGRREEWIKVKAEDIIQWILDVTPPSERHPERLVYRLLHVIISAIHTSSVTFLDVLHCLALKPEIHAELREEIERVFLAGGGWGKQTLASLVKLDSFMTEVARLCKITSGKLTSVHGHSHL
jgi:cytochrome P450